MFRRESPTRRANKVVKDPVSELKNLEVGNKSHPDKIKTKAMASHITIILERDSKACLKTLITVCSFDETMKDSNTEIQDRTNPTRKSAMLF